MSDIQRNAVHENSAFMDPVFPDASVDTTSHAYSQAGMDDQASSTFGEPASLRFEHWGYRHASRKHFAVRDLNLDIKAGERVLLLGASGIGKSTILEGAAGLLGEETGSGMDGAAAVEDSEGGLSEGSVLVDGVATQQASGRVGLVLQDPDAQAIFQRLGDNVAFGPENMDVPREQIWQRVHQSLRAVGLEGLQLHRSTMHLSGGQMQRLALAGALAMRPGVLLLDEPTANLDPAGVAQIVSAVGDVLDAYHSTMVLVEHRAGPWINLIDRVIVLGLDSDDDGVARTSSHDESEDINRSGFRRTVVVADGSVHDVFTDDSIDFAQLGIWVPNQYKRPQDVITRIHTDDEPSCDPQTGFGQALLSTRNLSIGRGGVAIAEHIDLDFVPGQITALVGANGAGKSTLSLTLAGLLEPVSGSVQASAVLVGECQSDAPIDWKSTDLASRISYVFQNPEHQFARGNVLEEVMLGPLRTGMDEVAAKTRAIELLQRFNLAHYAHMNPYTLSGGEKRRLTVASALAAAPKVLILDEPTFGQDRRTWMQIVRLIQGLRGDGVSIIVVTHDRDLVTALGAKLIELTPLGASSEWGNRAVEECDAAQIIDIRTQSAEKTTPANHNLQQDVRRLRSYDVRENSTSHADNLVKQAKEDVSEPVSDHRETMAAETMTGQCRDQGSGVGRIAVSPVNARGEDAKASSRSAFLASLNPSYRLIGGFLVALPLLFTLDWLSATSALVAELVILMIIGFTPWRIVKSTWPIFVGAPGSALAVLLYGKSGGTQWWHWGMMTITDRSAMLALATGIRILAIGIPAIIAVLGIDATDLADSFSQILHLPDRFVYGGLAGMRLFSVIRDDWSALTASRRSRGLGDENALKAFFPQAFALLVLSIRRSTMLAAAMQARGFGGRGTRSHARASVVHARDRVFLIGALAVPLIAVALSIGFGTFSFLGN